MLSRSFDFDEPRPSNSKRTRLLQAAAAVSICGLGLLCTGLGRIDRQDASAQGGPRATHVAGPGNDATSSTLALTNEWQASWRRAIGRPRCPAADREAAALLEQLARRNPEAALALAQDAEPHERRVALLCGILRGWATVSPGTAAAWLPNVSGNDLEAAEQALMEGAVAQPELAVIAAQQLVQSDPGRARSHANQLVRALSDVGDFQRAISFAVALPSELRDEMVATSYQYWALSQPELAFANATAGSPGEIRSIAVDGAISGWAQADPRSLAIHALTVSANAERAAALQTALRVWVLANPKAASDWMDQFDPRPELDAGAAAVALHPELVANRPEISASWAESITQPELRSTTLLCVLRDWISRDPRAALAYAQNSRELSTDDRAAVIGEARLAVSTP